MSWNSCSRRREMVVMLVIQSPPRFLSVFTGAGGLDLGLECAGFQSVGCIERDRHALASLRHNRPKWTIIQPGDIEAASGVLNPASLGLRRRQLDLLVGGPPCQPFSKAAQWSQNGRRGVKDSRSTCLTGFLQLISTFLPKMILIENVQGFISGKNNSLGRISHALAVINRNTGTNYQLHHFVVDAADYGVPQRRKRALLFAERRGTELRLPPLTHGDRPMTAWDAIGHLNSNGTASTELTHWLKLLPSIPEGHNYQWHTRRGGGKPLFGYRTKFWSFLLKLGKSQPAWTLPAQPGPYVGPFHWDNRRLTIQEMLCLQSFPRSWKLCGPDREQIRQVGNATPPLLAEVIGRTIVKDVLGLLVPEKPILEIPKSNLPIPPIAQLAVVDKDFREFERLWPDHPGPGLGPRPIRPLGELNEKQGSNQTARNKAADGNC